MSPVTTILLFSPRRVSTIRIWAVVVFWASSTIT
jgi:hypothetical protein